MRFRWGLVAIVVLFCSLAHAQNSSAAADRPQDVPQVKPKWSVSDWHCLRPMEEPSLQESGDEQTQAYRFLYIHSMQSEPKVVRLSIRPDGSGEVITKVFRHAGDCKVGKLTKNKKLVVPKKAVDSLLRRVEEAEFWQLPTDDFNSGLDGASWIVEGVKDGKYHVVDRWSPRKGKYKRLGEEFFKLGRLGIPYH